MIKAEGLSGFDGRFFAGFFDLIDLLFGVATGFGEKDFVTFDTRGLNVGKAMFFVNCIDFIFEVIKDGLSFWEELRGARDWRSIDLFHIRLIITEIWWGVNGGVVGLVA